MISSLRCLFLTMKNGFLHLKERLEPNIGHIKKRIELFSLIG